MKDSHAGPARCDPNFLWDPARARVIDANQAAIRFWGEASAQDLAARWFDPDGVVATTFQRLADTGAGVAEFSPTGHPVTVHAKVAREGAFLRVVLNDLETPVPLDAAHMSEGFKLAPRPLVVFDAVGALITQNDADARYFGPQSLGARIGGGAAAQALGAALVEGGFSRVYDIGDSDRRWRATLRRVRDAAGAVTVLAEFSEVMPNPASVGMDRQALAAIAHDFRAPLTAISGYAEFIASGGAAPEKHKDYLNAIQAAAEGLSALADRVVALGGAGDAPLELIDLNDLVASVAALNEGAAAQAGVTLAVTPDPGAGPVLGDPIAARRIVLNLVSNALRHSRADRIDLQVAGAVVTVADNGVGMTDAALKDALIPYGAEGKGGLGLPNCRSLAKSMAATLDYDTAPGQGFAARLSFAP